MYSLFSYSPIFLMNNRLFFTHFPHVLSWNFVQRNMCCEFIFLTCKLPRYFLCSRCLLSSCLHRIKIFFKSDSWQQLFVMHFLIFLFLFILTFVYEREFSSFSPFTIYVARQFYVSAKVSTFGNIISPYFLPFLCLSPKQYHILFRQQCCQLQFVVIQNFSNNVQT